jgi:transposase
MDVLSASRTVGCDPSAEQKGTRMPSVVIGVDPHKQSHTATALAVGSHTQLGSIRVPASVDGYEQLLAWAAQFPSRRWAVEGARGLGCHLTRWLLGYAEQVHDVPSMATARLRQLSRGHGRKTDALDAAAAAGVAALQGDAEPVQAETMTVVLGLLEERRTNLTGQRTRSVNQLHALLRELVPGGAPRGLGADQAAELLAGVRPVTAADRARKQLAGEVVVEIRGLDRRLTAVGKRIQTAVTASKSRLPQTVGIGPVIAGRLLGRTGRASRFPSGGHFASYAGVAPVEVASGERARHRLSRGGDRQLNNALHTIALVQARIPGCAGHGYVARKLAEGKTRREALRCLKRQLAEHVWRIMLLDEQARDQRKRVSG